MATPEFSVTYKARNVNSKRLLKQIQTVVEEVCNEYIAIAGGFVDRTYNYEELLMFLEMFFMDLVEKNVITHFDMIGDHRINNPVDVKKGCVKVHVRFRQFNCLNVTEITMVFRLI